MLWDTAEATIRSFIETNWALSAYASIPLVWENENAEAAEKFIIVDIVGTFSEKTIYGSVLARASQEHGIVFFHCFVPSGQGKQVAIAPIVAMTNILELQVIQDVIYMDGGNPPSPSQTDDDLINDGGVTGQPGGNYYRCSGSVPFNLIGVR